MAVSFVGAGAADWEDTGTNLFPGNPAGLSTDDLKIIFHWVRGSTNGVPATPTDWTKFSDERWTSGGRRMTVYVKAHAGEGAPNYDPNQGGAFTAGCFVLAYRGVDVSDVSGGSWVHATGAADELSPDEDPDIGPITARESPAGGAIVVWGAKGDDTGGSGVDTLTGDSLTWVEAAEEETTLGNEALSVVNHALTPSLITITNKTYNVLGGLGSDGMGKMLGLNPAAVAAGSLVPFNPLQSTLLRM